MDAVGAVHIGASGRTEHRRIALRASAETVRGGLAVIVGFGLDDAAADIVDKQADTDEIARNVARIAPEEIRRKSRSRTLPPLSDAR